MSAREARATRTPLRAFRRKSSRIFACYAFPPSPNSTATQDRPTAQTGLLFGDPRASPRLGAGRLIAFFSRLLTDATVPHRFQREPRTFEALWERVVSAEITDLASAITLIEASRYKGEERAFKKALCRGFCCMSG
jgi:hypothetical protein